MDYSENYKAEVFYKMDIRPHNHSPPTSDINKTIHVI